jgi:uncharacterized protein YjbJ (UPF0337 family)
MEMDLKTEGKWENYKGRIREAWGSLTDDDLERSDGKYEQLVGTIKEKTGEATDKVEAKLKDILDKA